MCPEPQGFISFIIFITVGITVNAIIHIEKSAFKGLQLYYYILKLNQHFTVKLVLLP